MSGYAEKEYLQVAIELKAVSYIEKPFTRERLLDVLKKAVSLQLAETRMASLAGTALAHLRSDLCSLLLEPSPDFTKVNDLRSRIDLKFFDDVTAILVGSEHASFTNAGTPMGRLESFIASCATNDCINVLWTVLSARRFVVLLVTPREKSPACIARYAYDLMDSCIASFPNLGVVAGIGTTVRGVDRAFKN